jgi:tetratricopeptide (TPR) repeat protein
MSESVLWNEMGNLHMRLGAFEDAISAYERAIELSPNFSLAYSNLGHVYYSKGNIEDAISLYQKSIKLSESKQEQSISWKRLGDVYQKLGEYEKALAAYKMGDEFDSQSQNEINIVTLGSASTSSSPLMNGGADQEPEPEISDDEEEAFELSKIEENIPEKGELLDTGEDDLSEDEPTEVLPPATPPFLPALDIPEDEFQTPEPWKNEIAAPAVEVLTISIESKSSSEEEFGELNKWLQSLERKPSSDRLVHPTSGWDGIGTNSPFEQKPGISPVSSPASESKFGLLEMDTTADRTPYFPAQTNESSSLSLQQPNSVLMLKQPDAQVVELEKNNHSELFKSWTLSESPEHDPGVWKCMLEALEKSQALENPEIVQAEKIDQTLAAPQSWEEQPTEKACVRRELLDGIENYRKITNMAPGNDKAWDTLGKFLKDAGEYDEAVAAFENAISLSPLKDIYFYHLGLVFAAQKRHDDAIHAFQKVIEINPSYILAHCALAGSYRRLGMETEAEKHIKVALPRLEAETEYNRACFEAICGNTDQAIELLRQALEMNQTSPEWVQGDPDLDFIRDDPRFKALVEA